MVIYSDQLLASKFTIVSIEEINLPNVCSSPPGFYLPTRRKFAPPYTSPNFAWNLLSDWL